MIVHAIEGRVRIRDITLSDEVVAQDLKVRLRNVPGITRLQGNPLCGSLLIHYDTTLTSLDQIRDTVPCPHHLVFSETRKKRNGKGFPIGRPKSREDSPSSGEGTGSTKEAGSGDGDSLSRKTFGQITKFGMLSALATSVFFAFAGKKSIHVISGVLFLVCLLMHTTRHSKRLLS